MATAMLMRFPATTDTYDQVNEELGVTEGNLPEGCLSHHAASTGDEMIIFDVWESREDFERFQNERLGPAVGKVMGGPPPEGAPGPTFAEMHNEVHR